MLHWHTQAHLILALAVLRRISVHAAGPFRDSGQEITLNKAPGEPPGRPGRGKDLT
jgi:hypothetical protein